MSQSNFPDRSKSAVTDIPPIGRQSNGAAEPTFLGKEYVCTELPTYITHTRTREAQTMFDMAYQGWDGGM